MNYAKTEFLSISGVIFSQASGRFAPDPHVMAAMLAFTLCV